MKGSVYQDKRSKKARGCWYYVIDLGISDGRRKQKRKGGFKTKREAESALAEVLTALNRGVYVAPSNKAYRTHLEEWVHARTPHIDSQTMKSYVSYIKIHVAPALGDLQLSKITPSVIQTFILSLSDKGLAAGTIKRIFMVVRSSLAHAVSLELLAKNPADANISKPTTKKKKAEIKVWNEIQVKRFLKESRPLTRYHIAFHLALATGMRQGEILGLRWSDVDLDKGVIYVRQTVSHDGKELRERAKTASSTRSVTIDAATVKELKAHRIAQAKERLAAEDYTDLGLVICTHTGKVTKPRDLYKAYERVRVKISVPIITFHDLRHTHASILLSLGVNPKVVQERLGHSSIQMTLDLYSHLFPNMQSEAAVTLGQALFGS
jgi:integrase